MSSKKRLERVKRMKILGRIEKEHNKVHYRGLPGQKGMFPYQHSPISLVEPMKEAVARRVAKRIENSRKHKAQVVKGGEL